MTNLSNSTPFQHILSSVAWVLIAAISIIFSIHFVKSPDAAVSAYLTEIESPLTLDSTYSMINSNTWVTIKALDSPSILEAWSKGRSYELTFKSSLPIKAISDAELNDRNTYLDLFKNKELNLVEQTLKIRVIRDGISWKIADPLHQSDLVTSRILNAIDPSAPSPFVFVRNLGTYSDKDNYSLARQLNGYAVHMSPILTTALGVFLLLGLSMKGQPIGAMSLFIICLVIFTDFATSAVFRYLGSNALTWL